MAATQLTAIAAPGAAAVVIAVVVAVLRAVVAPADVDPESGPRAVAALAATAIALLGKPGRKAVRRAPALTVNPQVLIEDSVMVEVAPHGTTAADTTAAEATAAEATAAEVPAREPVQSVGRTNVMTGLAADIALVMGQVRPAVTAIHVAVQQRAPQVTGHRGNRAARVTLGRATTRAHATTLVDESTDVDSIVRRPLIVQADRHVAVLKAQHLGTPTALGRLTVADAPEALAVMSRV